MSWKVVREDLEEKVEPVISYEMPGTSFDTSSPRTL